MAEISLNLDTTKTNIPNPTVVLRQGDSQYQSIRITVSDNYTPVDITTAVITFMGTTPAGTKIVDTNVSKASDVGVFDYTFPSQAGSTAGTFANAYFKISDGDKLGSTASFTIQVLDSIDMTQAEASDYVSVVDGVINSVKSQVESDIQTATSQLSGAVETATTNLNGAVSGAKSDLSAQVQTATDKLNQTIATGNYASQDYVQQTVTSGINAITKVANASHADVSDVANSLDSTKFYSVNGLRTMSNTYLAMTETWGFISHFTSSFEGDVTFNGNVTQKMVTGQCFINSMQVDFKRVGNTVDMTIDLGQYMGDFVPGYTAIPGGVIPPGFRPAQNVDAVAEWYGKTTSLSIYKDGTITTHDVGLIHSIKVQSHTTYITADDMPS